MEHTATSPRSTNRLDAAPATGPVANPQRTRLGADGTPVPAPVAPPAD